MKLFIHYVQQNMHRSIVSLPVFCFDALIGLEGGIAMKRVAFWLVVVAIFAGSRRLHIVAQNGADAINANREGTLPFTDGTIIARPIRRYCQYHRPIDSPPHFWLNCSCVSGQN
jgi:hypothetical protein